MDKQLTSQKHSTDQSNSQNDLKFLEVKSRKENFSYHREQVLELLVGKCLMEVAKNKVISNAALENIKNSKEKCDEFYTMNYYNGKEEGVKKKHCDKFVFSEDKEYAQIIIKTEKYLVNKKELVNQVNEISWNDRTIKLKSYEGEELNFKMVEIEINPYISGYIRVKPNLSKEEEELRNIRKKLMRKWKDREEDGDEEEEEEDDDGNVNVEEKKTNEKEEINNNKIINNESKVENKEGKNNNMKIKLQKGIQSVVNRNKVYQQLKQNINDNKNKNNNINSDKNNSEVIVSSSNVDIENNNNVHNNDNIKQTKLRAVNNRIQKSGDNSNNNKRMKKYMNVTYAVSAISNNIKRPHHRTYRIQRAIYIIN
jgi:hypothetical protein